MEDSRIMTEVAITRGRISTSAKTYHMQADYILRCKGMKLAVIEAKSDEKKVGDGIAQAKEYAKKLAIRYTYATNGNEIYCMDLTTNVEHYPCPKELWQMAFGDADEWQD